MQNERFIVKYITANDCFLHLPASLWRKQSWSRLKVARVAHNDVNYYLSCCAGPTRDAHDVCLSATFARSLNIREGDEVFVSCAEEAPALTSVVVAPRTLEDREILELQAVNIQSNLLDQIIVVAKNQTIIVWISKCLSITLIVNSLNPEFKYGRLEDLTEIHVGEALTKPLQTKITSPIPLSVVDDILNNLSLSDHDSLEQGCVYRVHPIFVRYSKYLDSGHDFWNPFFEVARHRNNYHHQFIDRSPVFPHLPHSPFRIYVSQPQSLFRTDEETRMKLCRVRKAKEDRQHEKIAKFSFGKKADGPREFVVQVCPVEEFLKTLPKRSDISSYISFARHPIVHMSEDLMRNLRVKSGGKVILEPIVDYTENNHMECSCIEIYRYKDIVTEKMFRDYVIENSTKEKILLNSQTSVAVTQIYRCFVKLIPDDCVYDLFDEEVLRKIDVKIVDGSGIEDDSPVDEESQNADALDAVDIVGLTDLITECKLVLILSLGLHNVQNFKYDRENILIIGSTGSGKTTFCKLLSGMLISWPYFIYTRFIDCKSLKGKKVEVIQKLLTAELSSCVYYQPSVIFFDDIEIITSVSSNTEETTPDSTNAARIADAIFSSVREYQATNYISVVATCTDIAKVGKKLREARGNHFFRTILTIPALEKEERVAILRSSLNSHIISLESNIEWDDYGTKTEGWVAQDLQVLADKAAFNAWKRKVQSGREDAPLVDDAELALALSGCQPLALRGVTLYRGAEHGWRDVGGLEAVKLALLEMLDWPLRYPAIFGEAPVKLQSGVLLYGMPGTGKTMIAGAIAAECGLNLISVKGPELLSKYIGESSAAVRNVFEKAQRAKPCVLFFDEFDSLAPRRGQDSVGVMDRVVNQLLTYLDGIEGREGVAVVAASARPDLMDPALLRPGRLDRSLLCPLPDQAAREEILAALCRRHEIAIDDLDLGAIAELTDGYTGADLNAVLVQARLDAAGNAPPSLPEGEKYNSIAVTQAYLIGSVESTNPSLTASQKEKYTKIYTIFSRKEKGSIEEYKCQKATLA